MQFMFNEGPSASTNHFMNMTNRDSKRVGGGLSRRPLSGAEFRRADLFRQRYLYADIVLLE